MKEFIIEGYIHSIGPTSNNKKNLVDVLFVDDITGFGITFHFPYEDAKELMNSKIRLSIRIDTIGEKIL
jgi:hypothetical protein